MEGSNGFGIDSILSHRPGSPAVPKGDPLLGDCRSPLELSPRSEVSSGCPSPPSPGRECLEAVAQRQGVAVGLDSHLQPGQVSAPSQSRTVTSSFLIRDILADCKPLAACAPYSSTNGQSGPEPAGRGPAKPGEDFREKMDKSSSNVSSDSEYKGKRRRDPRALLVPPHGARCGAGLCEPPRLGKKRKNPINFLQLAFEDRIRPNRPRARGAKHWRGKHSPSPFVSPLLPGRGPAAMRVSPAGKGFAEPLQRWGLAGRDRGHDCGAEFAFGSLASDFRAIEKELK